MAKPLQIIQVSTRRRQVTRSQTRALYLTGYFAIINFKLYRLVYVTERCFHS